MSFTDQKPRIATEKDVNAAWSGRKSNFRCGFCGHKFKVGDQWRWIFTNDMKDAGGNPFVCQSCDADNETLRAKWRETHKEMKTIKEGRLWWFFR